MNKRRIVSIVSCLFFLFPLLVFAQNEHRAGVGEVSEIIIPTSAQIQNNFNLLYEVHVSREGIPTPSFWYKIVFIKDCFFEFTLLPLIEDDRYDFYFYKVPWNMDFCTAVKEEKIVSYNTEKIHKTYSDTEQSEKFRSNLVDIKSIPVKANDAIYIEVFSVHGNDCGHVLDFRTSSTSFITKVVNDNCSGGTNLTTTDVGKYKPERTNEKQALGVFRDILCPQNVEPVFISSIQVNNENATIQKKLDFAAYSKSEAPKYNRPLSNSEENLSSTKRNQTDSITERTLPDALKNNPIVKSTADLNSIDETSAQIKHEIVCVKTENERNGTRLEVDYVLFSLLHEDLKRKTESFTEQLKEHTSALKKTNENEKRQEISASIKETKEQKAKLQTKLTDTETKLKSISKLLREERKKKVHSEESIFTKCDNQGGAIQQDYIATVKQDSSSKAIFLPKLLIYKVQIGVYKTPVSADIFKGLTPVFEERFSGGVKYSAGAFARFSEAQQAKNYIKNMGLADAFIIAYYKGKRVSIEEAMNHENE